MKNMFKNNNIVPKILIEPLMRENNKPTESIMVYCINNYSKYVVRIYQNQKMTIYDENLEIMENIFEFAEKKADIKADVIVKQTVELSKKLAEDLNFVRVDWMVFKNKIYFEELTFTPYSGFHTFNNKENALKLGNLININCSSKFRDNLEGCERNLGVQNRIR